MQDQEVIGKYPEWVYSVISLSSIILLIFYVVYMSVHLLAILYGGYRLHSWKSSNHNSNLEELPPVSVIKPIIGADCNLKINLESFFKLNYPKYELLLCIAENESDCPPSIAIINELINLYPQIEVRIFMGASPIGINPKINNMITAYQSVQYELIWLSDSNILTSPDTLTEMVSHVLNPQVVLVHQLPYVASVKSFADCLDKIYFGTQHSRVYLWANLIGRNCANGMSWVFKKSALEEEGGFAAFSEYLAEDFFMGKALWNRGWKFSLSSFPALQNAGSRSFSAFRDRIVRWGRLRATMMPIPGLFEPFTECLMLGIIGSVVIAHTLECDSRIVFVSHCLYWFICDMVLLRIIETGSLSPLWKILLMWLLRELWTFPLFLTGAWGREVHWRGSHFRLQIGGKARKLD